MHRLDLVPIYVSGWRDLLDELGDRLAGRLPVDVRWRDPWFDPEASFSQARGQYDSTAMLRQLLEGSRDPAGRVLGVAGVDLCTSVLTYVFGEAQLSGRAAVVSLHRLRPEAYGLEPDRDRLFQRLLKEAVHELGHTYGLVHCRNPSCVMRASTYVEDIDLKGASFCDPCLRLARRGWQ